MILALDRRGSMREYNWKKSVEKVFEARSGRKVIICGTDVFSEEIVRTIKYLGIEIEYIIGEGDEFEGIEIRPINKITEIDKNKYFVLVPVLCGHKEKYNFLVSLNLEIQKDFAIMGIGGYTELLNSIDSLLTLNRVGNGLPGFKIFSNNRKEAYKIVVLGNSTSDATTGNIKSWSEFLYERLVSDNYPVKLYCGAITGYSSTQEYLKLNRDVVGLMPNLVISFSGYNDIKGNSTEENYPYVHKYQKKFYNFLQENPRLAPDSMYVRNVSKVTHGLPCMKEDYEIWVDNMRAMNAVCHEFGIQFRAFLQPMVEYHGPVKNQIQQEIVSEYYRLTDSYSLIKATELFCIGAKKEIEKYPYIIDMTELFRNATDVFYDTCHCNEKGNLAIAYAVYDNIKRIINEWTKNDEKN